MEAIVFDALLSAASEMLVKAIPSWVSGHPKSALIVVTAYALLEHLWPVLAARGFVKGNSTLAVLLNACAGTAHTLIKRKDA